MKEKKHPNGKLLIIGGAEDKGGSDQPEISDKNTDFENEEILKYLLPTSSIEGRLEIVTTASTEPKDIEKRYRKAFKRLKYDHLGFIHIQKHQEASDARWTERINDAHAVLFSGGDQARLISILGGSPFIHAISKRYMQDEDFLVAGTSAGAMAACYHMLCEGETDEAMLKGAIELSEGFGLINDCIIDTHFVKRGRFGRLAQAVGMHPDCVGIGLGEDTALLVAKGQRAHCIGSGMVVMIDGKKIAHTNIDKASENQPLYIEGLKVDILCEGTSYELLTRRLIGYEGNE